MKKLLLFIFSLLVWQSTFAASENSPTTCPSVKAFVSVGVDSPFTANGFWSVSKASHAYGTSQLWTFIFTTGLEIDDAPGELAIAIANLNIARLTFKSGPLNVGDTDTPQWWCFYEYKSGDVSFDGVAITPTQTLISQFNLVEKFFVKDDDLRHNAVKDS